MKKKVLSLFLALTLVMATMTVPASAYVIRPTSDGGVMYEFESDEERQRWLDGDPTLEYTFSKEIYQMPTPSQAPAEAEGTSAEAIPCKYDEAGNFSEGLAAVKLDGKWGFIDKTGKEVVPCKYDTDIISYEKTFSEGLAAMVTGKYPNNKWGFIDTTGKETVPFKYDGVEKFSGGLAVVRMGPDTAEGKYGFIDKTGKEVVPVGKYSGVNSSSEGLAAVTLDDKWGFIDAAGKEAIPCTLPYYLAGAFSEGLARVAVRSFNDEKWGFIDTTGKEVIPCKYNSAKDFSEGLAAVRMGEYPNEKSGFIDKTGKEVVPCKYDNVREFSEGLAVVYLNGKGGFIDKTGTEVIPCKYEEAGNFSEGLAAVKLDGKWGFIDTAGKEIAPCKYGKNSRDALPSFSEGFAAVMDENGKYGFIDKTGQEVIPCKYSYAKNFSEGLAAVKNQNGKWGFISVDGAAGETPAPGPAPTATTAYASTQTVMVDNRPVEFNAYALKDANGNMTNYVKLRDVASVLNGSAAQFQVGWDGSITITTKQSYTANGSEMVKNFNGDQQYTVNTSPVKVNGAAVDMEAITLTDSTGGYTYFKLRDLGKALGFNVSWIDGKIVIDPNSPYSDAN